MLKELVKNRLLRAIENKIFPGAVVGIVQKDIGKLLVLAGRFTYDETSPQVEEDSMFDVASVTKSIPTACLALKLIESGKLSLEDKIIKYVPEFKNKYRQQATLWHLLTQTLDFGHIFLSSQKNNTPKEILNYIFTKELESPPGSKYWYMNATSILLGLVVERAAQKPLDVLADEMFFKPLGMLHTTFHPEKFAKEKIVPTEQDDWRGRLIHGEVHDETASKLFLEMVPGNAGLFSTAPDLLVFLEMLLNKGKLNGRRYFNEKTVEEMQNNQLENISQTAGLGWELTKKDVMGSHITEHTFGKTGFTGCLVVCDILKQIGVVILSNAVYPKRPENRSAINELRRDIVDLVFKAAG